MCLKFIFISLINLVPVIWRDFGQDAQSPSYIILISYEESVKNSLLSSYKIT